MLTDLHIISFLLAILIGVCSYYFKKWDAKLDKLSDLFNNHETRLTIVEKDIKQLQNTNTKN